MRSCPSILLVSAILLATYPATGEKGCPAAVVHGAVRSLGDVARALAQPLDSTSRVRQQIDDIRARLREACPRPPGALPHQGAIRGLALMSRLAGLWSGPLQTATTAGNFPLMNIDFRPVDGRALFGRTDLDARNGIRLSFSIEKNGKKPRLVFRSRGLFYGFIRDSRSELLAEKEGAWRFCAIERGCDYVDARFRFPAPDRLELTVHVRGRRHFKWSASRAEARSLPDPFPTSLEPYGTAKAPYPALPRLRVEVRWTKPLEHEAHVWLLLSRTNCHASGGCTVSRSLQERALKGATSAELTVKQLHPGDYKANVILDRNRNWMASFRADSGDGVAHPNTAVRVERSGETAASLAIFYDMP